MWEYIKNFFSYLSYNRELRKEAIRQKVLNKYLENSIIDLELRNSEIILFCIHTLLNSNNNELTIPYTFLESGQVENLGVRYEILPDGSAKFWLETINGD